MSWQAYIDSIMTDENIAGAAICGRASGSQDGAIWASTPNFTGITPGEIKAVCAGPGNGSTVTLAGVKAMVLKTDDSSDFKAITLVTMKNAERSESSPLIIGFSEKALVIGLGKPGYRGVGVKVENITKYLKSSGY